MTKMKKILAVALCVLLLGSVFAGCSGKKAEQTTEITDETLLIAYTADNAPFFQIDEKGNASGFEADLIAKIFDSIKDDCKNYAYVKVEPGYRLGEETAYTDKDGKTYIAYMAVGGLQKNDGTNNEDYSFTNTVISNRVVTLVKKDSKIKDYSNLGGAKLAVVSKAAQNALADNAVIADRSAKTTTVYKTAQAAFTALYQDKADAVVIDEFDLRTLDFILDGQKKALSDWTTELNGQLDTEEYAFATAKYDRLKDDINEALLELMALDFAIDELGLYLTTHPNDQQALELYWSYIRLGRAGRAKYEETNGPLLQTDITEGGFRWLDDPWPWDKGGND